THGHTDRFPNAWDALDAPLKAQADRLADLAKRGLLVLFLGSGISAGAGLPVWTTLLNLLAKRSGTLLSFDGLSSLSLSLLHLTCNAGMEQKDLEALRKVHTSCMRVVAHFSFLIDGRARSGACGGDSPRRI